MAETGHTPGPWKITQWPQEAAVDGFVTVVTDSGGHGLVTFNQRGHSAKVLANARLIAAAPMLLEACGRLFRHVTHYDAGPDESRRFAEAKELARAALATATEQKE